MPGQPQLEVHGSRAGVVFTDLVIAGDGFSDDHIISATLTFPLATVFSLTINQGPHPFAKHKVLVSFATEWDIVRMI